MLDCIWKNICIQVLPLRMWLKPSASPFFLHRIHGWKSTLRNTTIVSQHSNIVSHMPRCAQGVYQNHDKLEQNLPPCFAISFIFPPLYVHLTSTHNCTVIFFHRMFASFLKHLLCQMCARHALFSRSHACAASCLTLKPKHSHGSSA